MILLSYDEYQRLKSFEEKYINLKKEQLQETARKRPRDQVGSGHEQELEKHILDHENANENDLKPQKILEPITTPMPIIDIGGSRPDGGSGPAGASRPDGGSGPAGASRPDGGSGPDAGASVGAGSSNKGKSNVTKKRKKAEEEPLPANWWYIGKPKYQH